MPSRFAPLPPRAALSALILAIAAPAAPAGPLNPPPGPVAPTHKTLTDMEPRTAITALPLTISQPGSYYLARDLSFESGGITVTANNVTIDLNGFRLRAAAFAPVTAIQLSGSDAVVRNGFIVGGEVGIHGPASIRCVIENVSVAQSGNPFGGTEAGITLGAQARITGCRVTLANRGIVAGANSIVSECTVSQSELDGIVVGSGSIVQRCISRGNGVSVSFWHITAGDGSTVSDCVTEEGTASGIRVGAAGQVLRCVTRGSFEGIRAGAGARIEGCIATGDFPIKTGAGSFVSGCIAAASASGDGLTVSGTGSVIQNNRVSGDWGIVVSGPRNIISGNYVQAATTPFSIVAGNAVGQIVDLTAGGVLPSNSTANIRY